MSEPHDRLSYPDMPPTKDNCESRLRNYQIQIHIDYTCTPEMAQVRYSSILEQIPYETRRIESTLTDEGINNG